MPVRRLGLPEGLQGFACRKASGRSLRHHAINDIIHPALGRMDDEIRRGLENILNISLNDIQWIQATLPIRDGGLGVRCVSMLATSAYISRIDQVTRQCHPEQGGVEKCSPRRASRGPQEHSTEQRRVHLETEDVG